MNNDIFDFSIGNRRTGPYNETRFQPSEFSDIKNIIDSNFQPATPGLGPIGGVTPEVTPDNSQPAAPGLGPIGGVTPELTPDDSQPAAPGLGPIGGVTPEVSPDVTILPVIPILRYGYMRFINGYFQNIDIYVDNDKVANNIGFGEYTNYYIFLAGNHRVRVYKTGTNNKLYDKIIKIQSFSKYTGAFEGNKNIYSMVITESSCNKTNSNIASVRFISISENKTYLDIYVDDIIVIKNFYHNDISGYLALQEGFHNIKLTRAGTMRVVVEEPQLKFDGGNCYSIYILGDNINIPIQLRVLKENI